MGVNKPEGVDAIRQEVRLFRDSYGMKEPTATGFLSFLLDPKFELLVRCVLVDNVRGGEDTLILVAAEGAWGPAFVYRVAGVEETKHTSKAMIDLMKARRKGKLPGCIQLCLVRPK